MLKRILKLTKSAVSEHDEGCDVGGQRASVADSKEDGMEQSSSVRSDSVSGGPTASSACADDSGSQASSSPKASKWAKVCSTVKLNFTRKTDAACLQTSSPTPRRQTDTVSFAPSPPSEQEGKLHPKLLAARKRALVSSDAKTQFKKRLDEHNRKVRCAAALAIWKFYKRCIVESVRRRERHEAREAAIIRNILQYRHDRAIRRFQHVVKKLLMVLMNPIQRKRWKRLLATARGYLARKRASFLNQARLEAVAGVVRAEREAWAATKVQSTWKMFRQRLRGTDSVAFLRVRRLHAVITLQRFVRWYIIGMQDKVKRALAIAERQVRAAVTIQAYWRRHAVLRDLRIMRFLTRSGLPGRD